MSNQTRILCVDDERNVLRSLERIFLDDDYLILTAGSGEEGIELLNAAPQVQVVISDYRMPGMNGVEFLKEVCKSHPDTIRIVLSGYADTAAVVAAINEGKIYKFIPKPWNDDELRMTVAKALEHFSIHRRNLQLAEELRQKNEELRELNGSLEQQVNARTSELLTQNRALEHARSVLDHLPIGVLGLTPDGIVVQMNREAAQLLSLATERIIGEPMSRVLPPEISALAETISGASCGYRSVTVAGAELRVMGISMAEEGQEGSILTIMKRQGETR
jgi:response regulator RpfG family c-di-GMP phosphodiesterase